MADEREVTIARLGAHGDGVAETSRGNAFVPFSLPGERVRCSIDGDRGRLVEVLDASPDRVTPPCQHFGTCGGCALQHMDPAAYFAWKRDQVAAAFAARGIDQEISPVVACRGRRRRAALAAVHAKGGVTLGFHEAASHAIVDLNECTVLHPGIVSAFDVLRDLANLVVSKKGETRVVATWTEAGLDVVLDDVNSKMTAELRAAIAACAAAARLARVSVNRDPVYEGLVPTLSLGRAEVVPAPGAFLQAVKEMEDAMAEVAVAAAAKAKTVADLFCGLGAFTFRLAEKARVFSTDSDRQAIEALAAGA